MLLDIAHTISFYQLNLCVFFFLLSNGMWNRSLLTHIKKKKPMESDDNGTILIEIAHG